MIVVAGGGLAGLSAAYQLEKSGADYLLLEKEGQVGGLCRSIKMNGYTFDYSGHLLCAQNDEIRAWIRELLKDKLTSFERKASVYLHDSSVPYPFQANLGALPPEIIRECLAGFILNNNGDVASVDSKSWVSWVLRTFGEGIARHFFFPYHRKLWGIPLEELSAEGLEWSVPRPSLQQVVDGALGGTNHHLGYNPQFDYPTTGGIEELAKALVRRISKVRTSSNVSTIRWREKLVTLEDGQAFPYERIISSIPMPRLLQMLHPEVPLLSDVSISLRWVDVWVLNVGIRRENVSDQHWIYFPEAEYPFFRVGCYTAFGSHLAPAGCSSLYVEVPGHNVRARRENDWVRQCLEGLCRCGVLADLSEVDLAQPLHLPVAYVVFDHRRSEWVPEALAFLEEQRISPVGRYGAWGYGTMEQALMQGREAALKSVN
jgi:protoporphyrinogen oxidase